MSKGQGPTSGAETGVNVPDGSAGRFGERFWRFKTMHAKIHYTTRGLFNYLRFGEQLEIPS